MNNNDIYDHHQQQQQRANTVPTMKSKHDFLKSIKNCDTSPYPKQITINVDISPYGQDKLIKKENDLKHSNIIFKKANTQRTKENDVKDNEINTLNTQIQSMILKCYDLDMFINKEKQLRDEYEREQTRISHYCNEIKSKFANAKRTLYEYDMKLKRMKAENAKLSEKYDIEVEDAENGNKRLISLIDEKVSEFNGNKATIAGAENRLNDLKEEIEQQRKTFQERANINKIKFDELQKKYDNLQKKIYALQMNSEIRKKEKMKNNKHDNANDNNNINHEMEEMEKQLKDIEDKNKQLNEEVLNVNKKWKGLNAVIGNGSVSGVTKASERDKKTIISGRTLDNNIGGYKHIK